MWCTEIIGLNTSKAWLNTCLSEASWEYFCENQKYFVYIAISWLRPLLRLIWIHENTWYDLWNLSSFVVEYRGMAANANLCDPYLNTILLYSQSLLSLF